MLKLTMKPREALLLSIEGRLVKIVAFTSDPNAKVFLGIEADRSVVIVRESLLTSGRPRS